MKAVVTGAAGFIGSALCHRLLHLGWDVQGIDNFADYYNPELKRSRIQELSTLEHFDFSDVDVSRLTEKDLTSGVTHIFHLAGQPGVRLSWGKSFLPYVNDNIRATQNLLELAMSLPQLQRFVNSSSSSVYGERASFPALETDYTAPHSPYGVTKLAAEHLASLYGSNFQLPTVSLRYFTVYGPGQRPDMAFSRFVRAALYGETIDIYGSGKQVRDFTYVDDAVEANILAATRENVEAGSVFNICGATSISVNDTLDIIAAITGETLRVNRVDPVPGDVSRTGGSNSRAQDMLLWSPQIGIELGLRQQIEAARRSC
ncbi:NAD-dependent epimerase/dehydratase family protein [Nocardioidaceae bacterium]|nr:NAD-dependent epimerase/dehydratase family protein [Nocardioidaceae bacterium]